MRKCLDKFSVEIPILSETAFLVGALFLDSKKIPWAQKFPKLEKLSVLYLLTTKFGAVFHSFCISKINRNIAVFPPNQVLF